MQTALSNVLANPFDYSALEVQALIICLQDEWDLTYSTELDYLNEMLYDKLTDESY
jgi:hypothetical protein